MKVSELIEKLSKMPQDFEVAVLDEDAVGPFQWTVRHCEVADPADGDMVHIWGD